MADGRQVQGLRRHRRQPAADLPAARASSPRCATSWRCRIRRSGRATCWARPSTARSPRRRWCCGPATTRPPTSSEGRRIASMIPGARFEVMPGCGHWPQYEDPKTFNRLHLDFLLGRCMTDCARRGCHARDDVDVVIVGAGPVGLTLANILGLQGVQHPGGRGARHPDRLSPWCRARRRVAADLPVDRPGRRGPAAHRAQPDPAVLRRQPAAARRDGARPTRGSAGPSATASSSRWSTPNCCAAWTDSSTSRCGGATR